jgi:uncharacterized protein YdbL (DUF1318 family)
MCQLKNCEALRNGHAADLATQGHAIADVLESVATIEAHVKELPTRKEVLDIVETSLSVHTSACAAGRKLIGRVKPGQPSKFKLGKWLEAEGSGAMMFGVILGAMLMVVIFKISPYITEWLRTWFSK